MIWGRLLCCWGQGRVWYFQNWILVLNCWDIWINHQQIKSKSDIFDTLKWAEQKNHQGLVFKVVNCSFKVCATDFRPSLLQIQGATTELQLHYTVHQVYFPILRLTPSLNDFTPVSPETPFILIEVMNRRGLLWKDFRGWTLIFYWYAVGTFKA